MLIRPLLSSYKSCILSDDVDDDDDEQDVDDDNDNDNDNVDDGTNANHSNAFPTHALCLLRCFIFIFP